MPNTKRPTLAGLRSEAVTLQKKLKAHDDKVNSSLLLRLRRKVQGSSGISASARRSLVKRLDKIEETTIKKPTKDSVGNPVRRNKDGSAFP